MESQSEPFTRISYAIILDFQGSFMNEFDLGITDASRSLCQILLQGNSTGPQDSLFRDELFGKACQKVQDRNATKAIQDIKGFARSAFTG
jgi:hypothetical protein